LSLLLIKDNPYFINYKDVYYIYPKGEGWSYLPKILSVLPKNPNLVNLLIRLRKVCSTIYVSYKLENFKEIKGKRPISNKIIIVRFEYCDKAEEIGISVIKVDEAYTSQTCCSCGIVKKSNHKHRGLYICSSYKTVINADVNGAVNILKRVTPNLEIDRSRGFLDNPIRIRIS
jgi:transposase